ncbi:MAG: MFS transporter [Candidatus Delongbacteria bacterium]|nr:MFS transporter [Candidatus Delongbacteria bacterium]
MLDVSEKYKVFLKNYFLSSSLYDFVFAYAVYNLLFSENGLSVFQISMLLSWWTLNSLVFEIPSGALGDTWSRKKMLMLAPVLKSVCFVIWFFADGNFYAYASGFIFWSIGSSLISGTTEALLFDKLTELDKQNEYEKVIGRKKFYFHIALAISTVSGGFIAYYSLKLVLLLSVVPLLLSAYFASKIKEAPKVKPTEEIKYLKNIKIAYSEVKGNRSIQVLIFYALGISILADLEEFDQLYYKLAGLPIWAFGIAGFIWSGMNSIGAFFAHRFKNSTFIYYLLPVFTGALIITAGIFPNIPMISVLLLGYFISSPLVILTDSKIQHKIKSFSRATVISMAHLLRNFVGLFIIPIFGVLSKLFNLNGIYIFTGLFLILFAIFFSRKQKYFK